jgi:hypothetical protein
MLDDQHDQRNDQRNFPILFAIVTMMADAPRDSLTSEHYSLILKGLQDVAGDSLEAFYDGSKPVNLTGGLDVYGISFGAQSLLEFGRVISKSRDALTDSHISVLLDTCALGLNTSETIFPIVMVVFEYFERRSIDHVFCEFSRQIFALITRTMQASGCKGLHDPEKRGYVRTSLKSLLKRWSQDINSSSGHASDKWMELIKNCNQDDLVSYISLFARSPGRQRNKRSATRGARNRFDAIPCTVKFVSILRERGAHTWKRGGIYEGGNGHSSIITKFIFDLIQATEQAMAAARQARDICVEGQEQGDIQHGSMGVYKLVEGKELNGRGVWQMAGGQKMAGEWEVSMFNGSSSSKEWYIVGSNRAEAGKAAEWMKVTSTAITPDQITERWQVCDGTGSWLDAPKVRARVCSAEEKRAAAEMLEQERQQAMAAARQTRDILITGQEEGDLLHSR